MNLRTLVEAYQTDKVSTYQKLRYHVRENHRTLLRRLVESKGDVELSAIRARDIKLWHMEWSCDGQKLSIAHAFIAQLRTISGYGLTMMEEPECERLCLVLHKLRFAHPQPRTERLTAAQAIAIRAKAHEMGLPSIALAEAFQFEGMFRQKDIIGEYVPFTEPGESDIRYRGMKWLRGLRWDEIDPNNILRLRHQQAPERDRVGSETGTHGHGGTGTAVLPFRIRTYRPAGKDGYAMARG